MKKVKVIYRKLGKERALGQADTDSGIIEIDERLKGKKLLEILIHEMLHVQNPEWSETRVLEKSKELSNFLWSQHYRRVDIKEK